MTALPAQYGKFITALAGAALAYLTAYGPVWNLQGALAGIATALAVFGVPNATPPAAGPPPNLTRTQTAAPSPVRVIEQPPPDAGGS